MRDRNGIDDINQFKQIIEFGEMLHNQHADRSHLDEAQQVLASKGSNKVTVELVNRRDGVSSNINIGILDFILL